MTNTAIVKDARYLKHETGTFHPESPKRLEVIYEMLKAADMDGRFPLIEPRFASIDEIALVHSRAYIDIVAMTEGKNCTYLDPDTQASAETYEIARLAVGGLLEAVDAVAEKRYSNAFAFIRPPGHHAEHDRAAGFCIFNNVAIAALHAVKKYGYQRILVVDWDLHHGNGTQNTFYEDPRVLYFSTHQFPFYPGSGSINEIGRGKGLGFTVNVPLRTGPGDAEYLRIFRRLLRPLAHAYRPDLVLISTGFDIYHKDPLGGMNVTPTGFALLCRELMDIADECCDGRLVATLEGGYDLVGLRKSARAVLKEMADETRHSEEERALVEAGSDDSINTVIKAVQDQIDPLWNIF